MRLHRKGMKTLLRPSAHAAAPKLVPWLRKNEGTPDMTWKFLVGNHDFIVGYPTW